MTLSGLLIVAVGIGLMTLAAVAQAVGAVRLGWTTPSAGRG